MCRHLMLFYCHRDVGCHTGSRVSPLRQWEGREYVGVQARLLTSCRVHRSCADGFWEHVVSSSHGTSVLIGGVQAPT